MTLREHLSADLVLDVLREVIWKHVQIQPRHFDLFSVAELQSDVVSEHVDDGLSVVLRDVADVVDLASALLLEESAVAEGRVKVSQLVVEDLRVGRREVGWVLTERRQRVFALLLNLLRSALLPMTGLDRRDLVDLAQLQRRVEELLLATSRRQRLAELLLFESQVRLEVARALVRAVHVV